MPLRFMPLLAAYAALSCRLAYADVTFRWFHAVFYAAYLFHAFRLI